MILRRRPVFETLWRECDPLAFIRDLCNHALTSARPLNSSLQNLLKRYDDDAESKGQKMGASPRTLLSRLMVDYSSLARSPFTADSSAFEHC